MSKFPNHWSLEPFGEVTEIASGLVDPTEEPFIDFPHIGPENVQSGSGRISGVKTGRELGLTSGKYLFDRDAIVYSKIRPNLNKVCIPGFTGICSADMYPVWPKSGLDTFFLFQFMLSEHFVREATKVSARTGLPKINRDDLNRIGIPLPPLAEQRKIAAILGTWDEAIALVQQLIAALQTRKKALLQRLLTGEVRFPRFMGTTWRKVKMGTFLEESRIPGTDGEIARKLTVKLYGKGVYERDETRPGSSNTKYYIRRGGQFIYSKLDFLNGAFGIVPDELDGYETTLDLPAFDIAETVNPLYLLNYVTRSGFYKGQIGRARGGRKARRVPPSELLSIEMRLPSREEQDAIAEVIETVDTEIALYIDSLEQLKKQKQGLMQSLLTGEIRVRVDEDDHEAPHHPPPAPSQMSLPLRPHPLPHPEQHPAPPPNP